MSELITWMTCECVFLLGVLQSVDGLPPHSPIITGNSSHVEKGSYITRRSYHVNDEAINENDNENGSKNETAMPRIASQAMNLSAIPIERNAVKAKINGEEPYIWPNFDTSSTTKKPFWTRPATTPDDVMVSNFENYPSTKPDENECFDIGQVLVNGSCSELVKSGVCGEDRWLVLDKKDMRKTPPKITTKCEKVKCQFYEVYWERTETCVNVTPDSKSVCPEGNDVKLNLFGSGSCRCKTDYAHYDNGLERNATGERTCYMLYTRGPCRSGYQLVERNKPYGIECVKNPCSDESLVMWEDGDKKCYTLNTQGPCQNNDLFMISQEAIRRPGCYPNMKKLTNINTPNVCGGGSEKGGCPPKQSVYNGGSFNQAYRDANNNLGKTG